VYELTFDKTGSGEVSIYVELHIVSKLPLPLGSWQRIQQRFAATYGPA
jgi:hypothetical protein